MDHIKVNHLVIGAGVVGLAIAKELSKIPNATTFIIEKGIKFGMETSSRNSGVIHCIFFCINGKVEFIIL
jgi:L-2-hydroxyglutarate oxidase LhgO